MNPVRSDAGFTLVELLVSMALLGMAAVLIAQGFAADRSALLRIDTLTTSGESVAAAQDLIRDRIEHLFAQTRFDSAGAHVDLEGGADAVEFPSLAPTDGKVAQIERLRLALTDGGDLTLGPASAAGGDAQARPDVLLHKVQRLDLAYYGAAPPDGRPAWRATWSGATSPPQIVRVRAGFGEGDRRRWPELIVRPAATVDTACVLDVTTAGCRGRQ